MLSVRYYEKDQIEAQTTQAFSDICKNIRHQHQLTGMTQEKFAEALNVSTQYVSQIERGESMTSLKLLLTICYPFNYSIYSLVPQTKCGEDCDTGNTPAYRIEGLTAKQRETILSFIDWYTANHKK